MDTVSKTAQWTAAARAHESEREDRLFEDPWARSLAGTEGLRLEERFSAIAGGNPYLPIRTRVYDDLLNGLIADGADQIVFLGAGLDTRSLRLDWRPGVTVYEVERPELLQAKDEVLAEYGGRPTCDRRFVGADLNGEWTAALMEAGYESTRRSVWVAEGLLFYLPGESARGLLTEAAALAAPGSHLMADLIGEAALSDPRMRPYHSALRSEGAPWVHAEDRPEEMLAACGWCLDRSLRPGDEDAHFGRWPYPRVDPGSPGAPWSYVMVGSRAA